STSSTGSCSSISSLTRLAASRAMSSVSATTAQIGSPSYITSSSASTGSSLGSMPMRQRIVYQLLGTSLAVTTAATPGRRSALGAGRVGVAVEQPLRGHDHARGAVAALGGEVVVEGFLQRMQAAGSANALQRGHASAVDKGHWNQAREGQFVVQ